MSCPCHHSQSLAAFPLREHPPQPCGSTGCGKNSWVFQGCSGSVERRGCPCLLPWDTERRGLWLPVYGEGALDPRVPWASSSSPRPEVSQLLDAGESGARSRLQNLGLPESIPSPVPVGTINCGAEECYGVRARREEKESQTILQNVIGGSK